VVPFHLERPGELPPLNRDFIEMLLLFAADRAGVVVK
jgi:hypothetical protein